MQSHCCLEDVYDFSLLQALSWSSCLWAAPLHVFWVRAVFVVLKWFWQEQTHLIVSVFQNSFPVTRFCSAMALKLWIATIVSLTALRKEIIWSVFVTLWLYTNKPVFGFDGTSAIQRSRYGVPHKDDQPHNDWTDWFHVSGMDGNIPATWTLKQYQDGIVESNSLLFSATKFLIAWWVFVWVLQDPTAFWTLKLQYTQSPF